MTPLTAASTVSAAAKLLQDDSAFLPDNLSPAEAYAWAVFKLRCIALAFRLSAPASANSEECEYSYDDLRRICDELGYDMVPKQEVA